MKHVNGFTSVYTKNRYKGNQSQQNIKINSSISMSVNDLKHKILGLEQQLNNVSRHLISVESSSKMESGISITEMSNNNMQTVQEQKVVSFEKIPKRNKTKVLYKKSESQYKKLDDSDDNNRNEAKTKLIINDDEVDSKLSNCNSKINSNIMNEYQPNIHKYKNRSMCKKNSTPYSTSYHSVIDPRFHRYLHTENQNRQFNRKYGTQRDIPELTISEVPKKFKEHTKRIKPEYRPITNEDYKYKKRKRDEQTIRDMDQNFIADIIKKQYRSMRTFGKRESDISQFSAPICHDQKFPVRENILENLELCSCCCNVRRKVKSKHFHKNNLSDNRSLCDTQLYGSKGGKYYKAHRRCGNEYNDSALYDLIPVKEKASPKSRRKFIENNTIPYQYYKEVPPSPRTLRPQLNLNAQHFIELEEETAYTKRDHRKYSPNRSKRRQDYEDMLGNNEEPINKENRQIKQDLFTTSILQAPTSNNEHAIVCSNVLNKTQETNSSIDKTDKALGEIKDILQCFLQEIKKESISQSDKLEINYKTEEKQSKRHLNDCQDRSNTNTVQKTSQIGINNYGMSPYNLTQGTPFVPVYTNPCCHPILPVYHMNCMQSGYAMPSQSYTCANCINNKDGRHQNNKSTVSDALNTTSNNETDQLIKEIYNLVIQSPRTDGKNECCDRNVKARKENKTARVLTSRSEVCESSKVTKYNVKVGTPKINYSKSCEAMGSACSDDTCYSRTNSSYSDTILEKLSQEATATDTVSEMEFNDDLKTAKKGKENIFAKVLRGFGFLKKKKNAVIKELSESESTTQVDLKENPFRQEVTNYMMHGQEYFQHPPFPSTKQSYQNSYRPEQNYNYSHCYDANYNGLQESSFRRYDPHRFYHENSLPQYRHQPTALPYQNFHNNCNQMQPQIPLCLKEIKVKSIATQSDRKISFLRKFTKKIQPPKPQKNGSAQTTKDKPGLFNWKNIQATPTITNNRDPLKFTYKTQKQLADGDDKMRNAMLKKLFYKRNPFSPRNLMVRTLLGKDKSSFGEPPMMYRPRMFF